MERSIKSKIALVFFIAFTIMLIAIKGNANDNTTLSEDSEVTTTISGTADDSDDSLLEEKLLEDSEPAPKEIPESDEFSEEE